MKKLLPHARQANLFVVTRFCTDSVLREEGNKSFELDKSYYLCMGNNWNDGALYRKLCHVANKHYTPVEGNAKCETQAVNEPFGEKFDFDYKVRLVEVTIPSDRDVWIHSIGNGNSGMDAVAQAIDIDKTLLSKCHCKRPKKRSWKIELTWNMIHGMEENAQSNKNATQDDTVWLRKCKDRSSVTRTRMCSLKVPTAASWSNGSCNESAPPFKTMWTQNMSFGKLDGFDDHSEPIKDPDAKKLVFCGERSSVMLYKQKQNRNSQHCIYWGKTRM